MGKNTAPDICDLCGFPLRYGSHTSTYSGKIFRFCCMGCRQVFSMLMESSDRKDPGSFRETELFRKCREMGIIPRSEADLKPGVRAQGSPVPDQPVSVDRKDSENHEDLSGKCILNLNLRIQNMWCPACAWVIEEVLKKSPGIVEASCNFSTDRIRCDYDPVTTFPARIIHAIENLGYRALMPGEEMGAEEGRKEFIRFAISAFLTLNVMMLSFSLYSGFFKELSRDNIYKLSWPIFIMATIVLLYGGRDIYRRALAGLSSAAFSMETLITAGSLSAFIYSTVNFFSGSLHLYYDTASMLITLVLLGKTLERRAKDEVQKDLGNLFSLRPTKVRICTAHYPDGRYVAAEQLRGGDLFRVEEGEIVPADALILEGSGSVDESSLTGESIPISRRPGDRLSSGTRVVKGIFRLKAEGVGEDSTIGQMIRIMEKALGKKTPLEGRTDLLLRWFVPVILALSLGTGLVCYLSGLSPEEAMLRAVTVMVVSCPCTLGVAIPLARVAGITLAGRRGILVRDFSSFEQSDHVDTFILDKTGTITQGRWELQEIIPLEPFSEEQVLGMAVSLEKDADHYIAGEIIRRAGKEQVKAVKVKGIRIFANGISGYVDRDEVRIGSRAFMGSVFETEGDHPEWQEQGYGPEHSFVYMSYGNRPCAIFVFGDRIREGTPRAVRKLRAMGHRIALVSGDGNRATEAIGKKAGIPEAYGERLPQDKAAFIEELQKEGRCVAMVGDGINDAPALIQSDLAMAVYTGSHLGKEAADITLMRGDPKQILDFMSLARRVNRKVSQNLVWSFIYNVISIPIAMAGLLNPIIAVCAMLMSSLSVIGNTLLLIKKS